MIRRNKVVLCACLLALLAPGQGSGGAAAAQGAKGEPPLTLQLQGPPAGTWSLALSADGKFLVTGMEDAARLWDAASGREIRTFDRRFLNKGFVVAVCLSPDARWLVTRRSHDDAVHMWELATGKLLRSFNYGGDEKNRGLTAMALSDDGKRLAIGNQIWDTATGERVQVLPHDGPIETLSFSAGGKLLATGGGDGVARLWDAASGKELRAFAPTLGCSALALSGDGQRLVTAANNGVIRLWDTSTGKVLRTFSGHTGPNFSVALSADGSKLVTSGQDQLVRLWDVATGKELRTFAYGQALVALTPDGKWLATGNAGTGWVSLWDVDTGKELRRFQGLGLAARPSPKNLSGSAAAGILVVTPDGKWLVAGDNDGPGTTLSLWDLVRGQRVRGFQAEKGNADNARTVGVALSADGTRLAWARDRSKTSSVEVWDTATGKLVRTFDGETRFALLSADGKRLVLGDKGGVTRLLDTDTGKPLRSFEGNFAAALSPNGKWLCTGDYGTVRLWELDTGKLLVTLKGHPAGVTAVAVTDDAGMVVSAGPNYPGGGDSTVRVWDLDSGKALHLLPQKGIVRSLGISPDGRHLFSSGGYLAARLWDLQTGKELRAFPHERMQAAAASADHRRVFTCGMDRAPRVWDGETGNELCRLTSSAAGAWAVFDAAGRFDAPERGDVDLAALYWVRGLETFPLRQFRERFWDPGLLAKHLGFAAAPLRQVK
jgi:WD40 repeat protein